MSRLSRLNLVTLTLTIIAIGALLLTVTLIEARVPLR